LSAGSFIRRTSLASCSSPASSSSSNDFEIGSSLYDTMMPRRNVQKLARQLAEANKKLAVKDRYGPRGSTDPLVLDKHIRRLIARRRVKRPARV
jgi:hypothetical protein